MSGIALRMENVSKKFRKGEIFNSLRDLIPAAVGNLFHLGEVSGNDTREFWALQDISFEVGRGEALGIIGHNGAGKSTALKLLSRVMKPTKGTITVHGRLSALIEVSAGFHPDLTGRENIFLNGTILGMTKKEIQGKLDRIIAFSGIEEFIDTPVKRYSSGMHARLGFSVAAHVNPDILIVDEVLSVGDFGFQLKCLTRMREVIAAGATVLFVSHNLKSVAAFCHRCLLLEHGRMAAIGPSHEVIGSYLGGSSKNRNNSATQVYLSKVTVRNEHNPCLRFRSGEKAWVDIELAARKVSAKISVSLYILDDQYQEVFSTSTERLGHAPYTLQAGDSLSCTFELELNSGNGLFHICTLIYRYDTQTEYDRWAPAVTIHTSAEPGVGGSINCFPSVVRQDIHSAGGEARDSIQYGKSPAHNA